MFTRLKKNKGDGRFLRNLNQKDSIFRTLEFIPSTGRKKEDGRSGRKGRKQRGREGGRKEEGQASL
jgi:hypothetical protein